MKTGNAAVYTQAECVQFGDDKDNDEQIALARRLYGRLSSRKLLCPRRVASRRSRAYRLLRRAHKRRYYSAAMIAATQRAGRPQVQAISSYPSRR